MPNFLNPDNLILGISTRADGNMRLFNNDGLANPVANRELYFSKIGIDSKCIVSANLVHGNKAFVVESLDAGKIIDDCDALITNNSEIILAITVADCLPLYFYDKNKKVVAIAHGGWRGLLAGITENVIECFVSNYNSSKSDIEVLVGPHIKRCHFEIKDDVLEMFRNYPEFIDRGKKISVDLAGIAKKQLIRLGISPDNINISPECTYCLNDKYFSYRRELGQGLKTMVAYIGIKC